MSQAHAYLPQEIIGEVRDHLKRISSEIGARSSEFKEKPELMAISMRLDKMVESLIFYDANLHFGVTEDGEWFVVRNQVKVSDSGYAAVYEEQARKPHGQGDFFRSGVGIASLGADSYDYADQTADALYNLYLEALRLLFAVKDYQVKVLEKASHTDMDELEIRESPFRRIKFKVNVRNEFAKDLSDETHVIDLSDYLMDFKESKSEVPFPKLDMREFRLDGPVLEPVEMTAELRQSEEKLWKAEYSNIREWAAKMEELCAAKKKEIIAQRLKEFPPVVVIDPTQVFKFKLYAAIRTMVDRCDAQGIRTTGLTDFRTIIDNDYWDDLEKLRKIISNAWEAESRSSFGRSPQTKKLYKILGDANSKLHDPIWLEANTPEIVSFVESYGAPKLKTATTPVSAERNATSVTPASLDRKDLSPEGKSLNGSAVVATQEIKESVTSLPKLEIQGSGTPPKLEVKGSDTLSLESTGSSLTPKSTESKSSPMSASPKSEVSAGSISPKSPLSLSPISQLSSENTLATQAEKKELYEAIKETVIRNRTATEGMKKLYGIIFKNDTEGRYSDNKLRALIVAGSAAILRKTWKLFRPLTRSQETKDLYASFFTLIDFDRITSRQIQEMIAQLRAYRNKKETPTRSPHSR